MSVTRKALWIIERNTDADLTLDEIARSCGVSRFHLAHAFGQSTGQSVMHYLRGRRLSQAAEALARGARDILQLALASGYGSHEAFSRAFKARFGASPEAVRAAGTADGLPLLAPLQLPEPQALLLPEPGIEMQAAISAIGCTALYHYDAVSGIPGQWQRFMSDLRASSACVRAPPIGIATVVDADGAFEYTCAIEASATTDVPRGFMPVHVPARRCAVFPHDGHVSMLSRTYAAIYDRASLDGGLRIADGPCVEQHRLSFDPRTGAGGVDLYVPLAD